MRINMTVEPFFITTLVNGKAQTLKVPKAGAIEAVNNLEVSLLDKTDQTIYVKGENLTLDPIAIAVYDLCNGCKVMPFGNKEQECIDWFYSFRPELADKIYGKRN